MTTLKLAIFRYTGTEESAELMVWGKPKGDKKLGVLTSEYFLEAHSKKDVDWSTLLYTLGNSIDALVHKTALEGDGRIIVEKEATGPETIYTLIVLARSERCAKIRTNISINANGSMSKPEIFEGHYGFLKEMFLKLFPEKQDLRTLEQSKKSSSRKKVAKKASKQTKRKPKTRK